MNREGPGPAFRPDLYVVARVIEKLLQSRDSMLRPTQLQMKSGLNWNVFTKYLDMMVSRNLVAVRRLEDGEWVLATHEGRQVYQSLAESIRTILGESWIDSGRRGR